MIYDHRASGIRKILGMGVLVLAFPGCLGSSCMVVNLANPMVHMFIKDLTILNETDQELTVSPLVHMGGKYHALPLTQGGGIPLPRILVGGFEVAPQSELALSFDSDDVRVDGLLIKTVEGSSHYLKGDTGPGDCFRLRDIPSLPLATQEMLAVSSIDSGAIRYLLVWSVVPLWIICLVLWSCIPEKRQNLLQMSI